MRGAVVFICLFAGVLFESALWDDQMMQSPDELTVTDFELAEEGLSVVLTNALEDAREMVNYLTKQHDTRQRAWIRANAEGRTMHAAYLESGVQDAAEMQFRAMRVLGLLEATRDREAGQVT